MVLEIKRLGELQGGQVPHQLELDRALMVREEWKQVLEDSVLRQ